jgi:hypothetical protein
VLERERLELGSLEVATLLRAFDEGASLVGIKQFVQGILRQETSTSFRGLLSGVTQTFAL